MDEQKVVALAARTPKAQIPLPSQIGPLHKQLQRYLHAHLSGLFIAADSQFCKLSEQAHSNQDCEEYFDIAQQLRKKRNSIAGRQFQLLREQFQQLAEAEPKRPEQGLYALDSDAIGIVSEEQQEVDVAVRTMVNKQRHAPYRLEYEHLTTRMAALFSHGDVSRARNPFGGEALCNSFIAACELIEIPIRPRLMLFRLYEKHVLQDLGTLYSEANSWLKEQGVLPGLKGTPKPARQSAPVEAAAETEIEASSEPRALKSTLQALLRDLPAGQHEPVDQGSAALVELVASVQAAQAKGWLNADIAPGEQQNRLSGLLNTVEQLAQEEQGLELSHMERDVFKLVSLLFNYMCEDDQLPSHFKPLFNQLQLPVLKAALVDRGFFTHADHPARVLLERLSHLSVGLDEKPQQDRMFRLLEEQIGRLVNDFSPNVDLFEEVLAVINRYAAREDRRAELLEQRLKAAEEGQAKTEQARSEAADKLTELLQRYPVPPLVETLLRGGWQQYLTLSLLRQGAEGKQWLEGVQTAEQLLWSLQPKIDLAERKQMLKQIPELRRALREGLAEISYDALAIQRFLTELEPLHLQILRQGISKPRPKPQPVSEQIRAEATQAAQKPAMEAEAAEPPLAAELEEANVKPVAPALEPHLEAQERAPEVAMQPVEDSAEKQVEAESEASVDAAQQEQAALDPQWLAKIDQLQPGVWVQFKADSGDFRAKFAAYLRPTDRFIFVNRNGAKVAELGRQQLAQQLQTGHVVLLEDAQLFDRALESIITTLRQPR